MIAPVTSPTTAPRTSRGEFLTMMATLMALMAISTDAMLPAFPAIREHFGLVADSTATTGIISWFFFGIAISQLIYGPLADRFGRKPILFLGLGIYVVSAVWASLAPTLSMLYVARFFWGLGAAGPRVVVLSVVRDRFEGEVMAKALSIILGIFILVPVGAPALGAALISFLPWQSVFWFPAVLAVAVGVWALRLRETLNPKDRIELRPRRIARAAGEVIRHRATLSFALAGGLASAVLFTWLNLAELIVGDAYGRPDIFPYVFGGTAVFTGVAMFTNGRLIDRFTLPGVIRKAGSLFPIAALGLTAITFAAGGTPPMWQFLTGLIVLFMSFGLLASNLNTVAMLPLGHIAGTAAAVIGALTMLIGVVLALIPTAFFSGDLISFSVSTLVFAAVGFFFILKGQRATAPI